jgi:hypothetical protein
VSRLALTSPGNGQLVRISGRNYPSFAPPPWRIQTERNGGPAPLQNRFDDIGPTLGFPVERCFLTIYAATSEQAAYGELLADLRPIGPAVDELRRFGIAQALLNSAQDGVVDPSFPEHVTIPKAWRERRHLTQATLAHDAVFVDISNPATLTTLRLGFLSSLDQRTRKDMGLNDFDLSDVMSRNRALTQHLARYLHELPNDAITELGPGEEIAGIRYLSRHSPEWECWALFADRIDGRLEIGESRPIAADDPDLLAVARQFGLSVETDNTLGEYLRPWLGV